MTSRDIVDGVSGHRPRRTATGRVAATGDTSRRLGIVAVDDAEATEERRRCVRAIVESRAPRKIIVAGPGTGKTFTFGVLLRSRGGERLVLTFVRSLVRDLRDKLGGVAQVMTFHGFARWQLHQHGSEGLTAEFDYFPLLAEIQAEDAAILLDGNRFTPADVQRALHEMDQGDLLAGLLACGTYYDAVGYSDSVYRIVRHFEARPDAIPSFEQVVVDEYQDFNLLEVSLIRQLASRSPTLIVGDDDQALYEFKQSTPAFLRDLAGGDEYERFELPFCSRCPEVVVHAAHRIVERAQDVGLLQGRVERRFECFLPTKRTDSERYPKIVHADVTVDRRDRPYIAQYVDRAIAAIPQDEIQESWREGHPTVLVVGPSQFSGPIHAYFAEAGTPNLLPWRTAQPGIQLLDGYIRLADDERSRLGWRLVMFMLPPDNLEALVTEAIERERELADLLPDAYKAPHLRAARLVGMLIREETLAPAQEDEARSLGLDAETVRAAANASPDEGEKREADEAARDETMPSICVTTLESAKGLQAAHVFVVGVNAGHFPRANDHPDDHEVCCMLVALTRATKRCHVVSCGRPFGSAKWTPPGVFVGWLDGLTEKVVVNADYFR